MFDDVVDSHNMLHGGEVMNEYADATYNVRSGDEVVFEELGNELAESKRGHYVFLVFRRRVFDVHDCSTRRLVFLNED